MPQGVKLEPNLVVAELDRIWPRKHWRCHRYRRQANRDLQ